MKKVAQINSLHDEALELAGQAFQADLQGDFSAAEGLFRKAFDLEQRARHSCLRMTLIQNPHDQFFFVVPHLWPSIAESSVKQNVLLLLASPAIHRRKSVMSFEICWRRCTLAVTLACEGLNSTRLNFRCRLLAGQSVSEWLRAVSSCVVQRPSNESLCEPLNGSVEFLFENPAVRANQPFWASRSFIRFLGLQLSPPLQSELGDRSGSCFLDYPDTMGPVQIVEEFLACIAQFNAEDVQGLQQHIDSEAYFKQLHGTCQETRS